MKIVRFAVNGEVQYGVLDDQVVRGYVGSPFCQTGGEPLFHPDGTTFSLSEVRLLVPCEPTKVVGIGLNYHAHVEEKGFKLPEVPILFIKPTTALVGPGEYIIRPPVGGRIDYEGEVGVVIGKRARHVPQERASEFILGYTCVNDVSARYCQDTDGQWTRGKGFDTFCPVGPCIAALPDPKKIKIETLVNGEVRQSSDTSYLIFGIAELIAFITKAMTLLPGDIIATGTPEGIGAIDAGDTVEVRVEGVGVLSNPVSNEGS